MSQEIKVKGIGQKTLDRLYEAGYTTPEMLNTLNEEKLKELGIQTVQINILLDTLGIDKLGSVAKVLVDNAESEEFYTRAYQQKYDLYEMVSVYKYNMWKCEECGHDVEPRGQLLWQDPKTKDVYLRMRTVCATHCENRNRLYKLEAVEVAGEHSFNFE